MARFPWIQVTQETWGRARALGGVLGLTRREAFGLICDLWAWSLEQGPDDRPPSGEIPGPLAAQLVAGAVEWPGDPALLVAALEACGLLARGIRTESERDPSAVTEGLRVRGVDRYEATWKKNRMGGKRSRSERNPNGIRADTSRFPNAQTQTQTQSYLVSTETDQDRTQLRLTPTAAEKVRKQSEQERLAALMCEQRGKLLAAGSLPDPYPVSRLNKMCAPLVQVDPDLLRKGHAAFCKSEYALSRSPPAPLWLFCQEWSKWVDIAQRGTA